MSCCCQQLSRCSEKEPSAAAVNWIHAPALCLVSAEQTRSLPRKGLHNMLLIHPAMLAVTHDGGCEGCRRAACCRQIEPWTCKQTRAAAPNPRHPAHRMRQRPFSGPTVVSIPHKKRSTVDALQLPDNPTIKCCLVRADADEASLPCWALHCNP